MAYPYDDMDVDEFLLDVLADSNPSLFDFSSPNEGPSSSFNPVQQPQYNDHGIGVGPSNPSMTTQDPSNTTWAPGNQFNQGWDSHDQAGPSNVHAESIRRAQAADNVEPHTLLDAASKQIEVWPPQDVYPFSCSCCQVLRELSHFNGEFIRKLEIHGRLGLISHAILEIRPYIDIHSSGSKFQMFDFCKKSLGDVKDILSQYCLEQTVQKYTRLPDPLATYYEALCVGTYNDGGGDDQTPINPPTTSVPQQSAGPVPHTRTVIPPEGPSPGPTLPRQNAASTSRTTPLSAQRKRTGKMTLSDFRDYLHLPIREASKRMEMCPTVVKKICRRAGLRRWPYRKLKSYQRKLESLKKTAASGDAEARARAEVDIQQLRHEISQFLAGILDLEFLNHLGQQ